MRFINGLCALTLSVSGLIGCATLNEKPRNITEFIPETPLETKVIDLNKDGYLDMVYLTKSKRGYELKIMRGSNDGSFGNPELVRNYGGMDPRTLNWLTYFYHQPSRIIDGSMK